MEPAGPIRPQSWFPPNAGALNALTTLAGTAEQTLHVAAYTFTSVKLANALTAAALRGIRVQVILDAAQAATHPRAVQVLRAYPVTLLLDGMHDHFHCKFIVSDSGRLALGSFNFTDAADLLNAENLTILTEPSIARDYVAAWTAHAGHSRPVPTLAQTPA